MKRTPLFLTLGFFLIVAGGITVYQYYFTENKASVWDLIPKQTVLVYEGDDCTECKPEEGSIVGKILESVILDFSDSTKKVIGILSSQKKGNTI